MYLKENWKKKIQFPLRQQNVRPSKHLAQLPIWKGERGILDIHTQLNYLKITWIQKLFNPTNAPRKDLILYQLNIILNSTQDLPIFRQNWCLGLLDIKTYNKKTMKDFFIYLLNSRLHFIKNTFSTSTQKEKKIDQQVIWNLLSKLNFNSNNPYFYCVFHPKISQINLP